MQTYKSMDDNKLAHCRGGASCPLIFYCFFHFYNKFIFLKKSKVIQQKRRTTINDV